MLPLDNCPKRTVLQIIPISVTPANAGVNTFLNLIDSGFRRNDEKRCFWTYFEFTKINLKRRAQTNRQTCKLANGPTG
jgi:hypothetical protein